MNDIEWSPRITWHIRGFIGAGLSPADAVAQVLTMFAGPLGKDDDEEPRREAYPDRCSHNSTPAGF